MKIINSLKAYEIVDFVSSDGDVRQERIEHNTFALDGYPDEESAAKAICSLIADHMAVAILKGGHTLMLNRVGPTTSKEESGWRGRWRGVFVSYAEPTVRWEKTEVLQ